MLYLLLKKLKHDRLEKYSTTCPKSSSLFGVWITFFISSIYFSYLQILSVRSEILHKVWCNVYLVERESGAWVGDERKVAKICFLCKFVGREEMYMGDMRVRDVVLQRLVVMVIFACKKHEY